MLVFICPETQGSYRGFAYDAVAIAYYNDDVLKLLDNSAFEGNASNYVIYPDGRVIIDDSVKPQGNDLQFHCDAARPFRSFRGTAPCPFGCLCAGPQRKPEGQSWATPVIIWSTRIPRSRTGRCWGLCRSESSMPVWTGCGSIPYGLWQVSPLVLLCWSFCSLCAKAMSTLRRKNTEISVPGRAVPKAFDERGRRFPDAGRQRPPRWIMSARTSSACWASRGKKSGRMFLFWTALHPKDAPEHGKNFLEGLLSGEAARMGFRV